MRIMDSFELCCMIISLAVLLGVLTLDYFINRKGDDKDD